MKKLIKKYKLNKLYKYIKLIIITITMDLKYASMFDDLSYINKDIETIPCSKLSQILYNINVDRCMALHKLAELLKNIDISNKIEAGIFEFTVLYIESKNINIFLAKSIYLSKFNDIYDNLNKNSHIYNPELIKNLSKINLQMLAFQSPQELNKNNWDYLIKKFNLIEQKRKNIATTDLYKCYKCGERKCQITEMQTRSADEPITKFITCLECGNVFRK